MPDQPKNKFLKIAVQDDVKREIDIIAASEQRDVYAVVSDMLEVYKTVKIRASKKSPKPTTPVTVAEYIASH
jgi:hypothetical protein